MNNKKITLIIITGILFLSFCYAQNSNSWQESINKIFEKKSEVYFKFKISSRDEINTLTKIISIDDIKNNEVYAYANRKEFIKFSELNYDYSILQKTKDGFSTKMLNKVNIKEIKDWDFYPTYEAYVDMMYQFQTDYPDICEVFCIGYSVEGRELIMAKITDNISSNENEPQFLYTGQMHGDELVNYI
ncbi:MAG: hypothetical protein K8R58_04230, partial [Bacteroidales bacterium]|nr:hypothetical protein [Bacteroidales bacterium]